MLRRFARIFGVRIWEVLADSEVVYWTVHKERAIMVGGWARYQAHEGVKKFGGKVIHIREVKHGVSRALPDFTDGTDPGGKVLPEH